ncbi:putative prevent-host-death family protein [Kineosphaera limosa NBRC 100340]|uniref:Putative prevent-host-death family protein n=2 Tax=Kineosphaera TaxID=211469 RepID=K6WMQ8_9MICO|nr:putative prevent-host-death family protein [Kineosphaera limosa NBRC 100340]
MGDPGSNPLQHYIYLDTLAGMTKRVPITLASRQGVSRLAAEADRSRIILTSHGRPVAVVDSAERLDEDARKMREAAAAVLDSALAQLDRRSERLDLAAACERLGVSLDKVLARADELSRGGNGAPR